MLKTLATIFALGAAPLYAQGTLDDWTANPGAPIAAQDIVLADFIWQARPLIIFADTPLDPSFAEQMDLLRAEIEEVIEREVVIITDTDPAIPSALRTKLRPRGFMWVLVGKDGQVKLRKPFAWDVRELSRVIDKMPMRKREIQSR